MELVERHQSTFLSLRLLINQQKSIFSPVQSIEFIGAVLDSAQARAFLLESCFRAIEALIKSLRAFTVTTAGNCLKLLGHVASCTCVMQHARLKVRALQTWLALVYTPDHHPLDKVVT